MIPLNTRLGLPSRAFWYVALRSLVIAFLVVLFGSLVQLITTLPGSRCGGHACNPASGAHIAAWVYAFAAFLVVRAALNFKWYEFVVTDRNISVTSGVLARNTNTIRFDRVQDVSVRRDPLHALLGLKSVAIWTASPDQRIGNARRPDGSIVLEADDADWLRDYISDPPAAATAGKVPLAPGEAPHGGSGAVVAAMVIAVVLLVLAAMAAMKRSPPPSPADAASANAPPATYVARRGADGKMHLHLVPGNAAPGAPAAAAAPASAPASAATRAAAAAPPVATVQNPSAEYGLACAIDAAQATATVRACAQLPTAERCDHEMDFPSTPTAEPAVVSVINKSSQPVKFYWLNQSGNRALYATLPPGGRVDQQSHTGAHWLFATAAGQCLGVIDAATMKVGIF